MLDPSIFDDVAKRLRALVPGSMQSVPQELEKNFKAVLQSAFAKFNIVTREEFDVQVAALKNAQLALRNIEQTLQQLEDELAKEA